MLLNEKELNCSLFDQLSILERIERAAKKEKATETLAEIDFEKQQINRKLYQQPPLQQEL